MKSSKVLCSMIVLLGMILGLAGASAEGVQFVWDRLYGEAQGQTGTWTPTQHNPQGTGSLAQSFVAPNPFIGVRIASPSWNGTGAGFRMRLFAWNTDYATSVAGAVLGEASIVNYADNSSPQLMLAAAVPAGNYLLVTDEGVSGTGASGHWGWSGSNLYVDPTVAAYSNGTPIDGLVFDIGIARAFARPYTTVEDYFTPGAASAISLAAHPKIGQRFTATQLFDGVEMSCPSWSTNEVKGFTVKLYNWAGSYAATVAQAPLATKVYTNTYDNFWYFVGVDESAPALPPGQYFWEMSEPTSTTADLNVGCWLVNQSAYSMGEAYIDGVAQGATNLTWIIPFNNSGQWTPTQFLGAYPEASLSQTFEVSVPIYGVGINSPSWSGTGAGYRMRLYAWDTDYNTTLGGTVLAEKTFTNYTDNGWNQMELVSPLPAGQYMIHTDQPVFGTGAAGHWGWKNSSFNTGTDVPNAYLDGYKATDYLETYGYLVFNISYATMSEIELGPDFQSRAVVYDTTAVQDWTQY